MKRASATSQVLRPRGAPSEVVLRVPPTLFVREWRSIEREGEPDEHGAYDETHWTALWLESEHGPVAQLNHIAQHGNKAAALSADGAWVAADDRSHVRFTSADGALAFSVRARGVAGWPPGWTVDPAAASGPVLLRPGWVPYPLTPEPRLLQ